MLDAFIIDELRRREKAEKDDSDRPRLELPLDHDDPAPSGKDDGGREKKKDDNTDEESDRGVVIIDL